jgi:hypothetical protein
MYFSESCKSGAVLVTIVALWMGATFLVTGLVQPGWEGLITIPSIVSCPCVGWAFVRTLPRGEGRIVPQSPPRREEEEEEREPARIKCDSCKEDYPDALFFCGHSYHLACIHGDRCETCGDGRGIRKFHSYISFDSFV